MEQKWWLLWFIALSICGILYYASHRKEKMVNQQLTSQRILNESIAEMAKASVTKVVKFLREIYNEWEASFGSENEITEFKASPEQLNAMIRNLIKRLQDEMAEGKKIPELKATLSEAVYRLQSFVIRLTREDRIARKYLKSSRRSLIGTFEESIEMYRDPISFCRKDFTGKNFDEYQWLAEVTPLTITDSILFSRIKNQETLDQANKIISDVAQAMYEIDNALSISSNAEMELNLLKDILMDEKEIVRLKVLGIDVAEMLSYLTKDQDS